MSDLLVTFLGTEDCQKVSKTFFTFGWHVACLWKWLLTQPCTADKLPVYWWINRRLHNCGGINVLWGALWPALWEIVLMATFEVLHCHIVSANTRALTISNLRETVLFADIQLYTHARPNADQRDKFLPITTNNALARKIPAAKWPIWSRSSRSLLNFINSIMWIYSSAGE